MTSTSARSAGVVIALYFAYEIVAGVARLLSQISVLFAQHTDAQTVALTWLGIFFAPIPYVVVCFALLWLWPVRGPRTGALALFALIGRAAIAAAGGAMVSMVIGAITATRVSGGWFTSMPREYSFPGWIFGQMPSILVNGFIQNFPVLALAAAVATAFVWMGARGALPRQAEPPAFDRDARIE